MEVTEGRDQRSEIGGQMIHSRSPGERAGVRALPGVTTMRTMALTQGEADALIAMPKLLEVVGMIDFPTPGERAVWQAASVDGREKFVMDVNRGRLRLIKCTYQERYRLTEILVRVDVGGPPHRNPDGVVMDCPHIHVYREGFADKWAEPLPQGRFGEPTDLVRTFRDFLGFCNLQHIPEIQASLQ